MTYQVRRKLNAAENFVLAKSKVAALVGLFVFAIVHPPAIRAQTSSPAGPAKESPLAFEVASIRPFVFARNQFAFPTATRESRILISGNRISMQGLISGLVLTAYRLRNFQVLGSPEWRDDTGRHQIYVIEAKAPGDGAPTTDEVRQMLQTLLAERFQLKFHWETKELPAYALVVGNSSPELKRSAPDVESKTVRVNRLRSKHINMSLSELVLQIGPQFDRPLFDRTGLEGGYDFALEYVPSLGETVSMTPDQAAEMAKLYPPDEAPPLRVALQRQLGLKVVPTKEQVKILVIDHVERPSEN